jgi:4-diphosphocytidyl-2-C-methyl-D-erythritol kinase
MNTQGHTRGIHLCSPAKINLSLRILGVRPDGYHELETWIQQVSLFDQIDIRLASRAIRVTADRGDVPSGRGNLAYLAASALREVAGDRRLGATIRLEKHIPSGAGLGGGSGNAAAVLWALNRLWGLGLSPDGLMTIGARIGSDVPFFLGSPMALCRGRGEVVSPKKPLRSGWIVLVKPAFSLSTASVYGWMRNDLKHEKKNSDIKYSPKRKPDFQNDLEQVVFQRYPILLETRDALMSLGARQACMSGSGPALWGLFRRKFDALEAAEKFSRRRRWTVHLVKPLASQVLNEKSVEFTRV